MEELFLINGLSSLSVILAIVLFLNSISSLFFLKETKLKWLDVFFQAVFVCYWIATLFSPEPLKYKLFVTVLILAIVIVRLSVKRKRGIGSKSPPNS
jgi:hypothetical protein